MNVKPKSEILDSPPPSAIESEGWVLDSVLIQGRVNPDIHLRQDQFYDWRGGVIFQIQNDLDAEYGGVDTAALIQRLQKHKSWGKDGFDAAYVASIKGKCGNTALVNYHVNQIVDAWRRRVVASEAEQLLSLSHNGFSADALQTVLGRITSAVSDGGGAAGGLCYKRLSCAELDQGEYNLEYLIDRTLVAGQPCIVAGGKKCLKTSILLDMGISLATGGCFLGRLRVNRACKVGIMTGESGLGTIQETARRICYAAGHRLADIDGLVFSEDLPRFGSFEHEEAIRRFILADALDALILDPAYLCLPGADAGNLFAQGDLLRGMSGVCTDTGCMMILAHHTRKTKVDPFSPPELEDIAWAGFQEFARQWLLVGRREAYQPGTGDHRLWLSVGGSAGHTALWAADISEGTRETEGGRFWQVNLMHTVEARGQVEDRKTADKLAKADAAIERDKKTVCNTMAKFPNGESKSVIRDTAGLFSARFNAALSALLADGEVVSCEVSKPCRKTPFSGYKLAE